MKVYEAWEKRVWYPGGAPSWRRVPPVITHYHRRVGPVLATSMRRITGARGKMIAMGISGIIDAASFEYRRFQKK